MTSRKEKIESFLRELIVNVMRSADTGGAILTLLPTTSDNIARVKNAIEPTIESFSKFYLDDEGNWKPEIFGEASKPEPKGDLGEVGAELVLRVSKLEQKINNISPTEEPVIENKDQFSCFDQTHIGDLFEDFFKEVFKDFDSVSELKFKQRADDSQVIERRSAIPTMIYAREMYIGTIVFGGYTLHISYLITNGRFVIYQCISRKNGDMLIGRDFIDNYPTEVQIKVKAGIEKAIGLTTVNLKI